MNPESKYVGAIDDMFGGKEGTTPYWKVTWHDGKSDNMRDEGWVAICRSAYDNKRMVTFKKEPTTKGDKTYWNIVSLELAQATTEPVTPTPPQLQEGEQKAPPVVVDARIRDIHEQVAIKEIGELIRTGIVKDIGSTKPYWVKYWLTLSTYLDVKEVKKEE